MCDHKRKLIGKPDSKTGLAIETCMECGINLGEIPASFATTLEYCTKNKIRTHYAGKVDYESQLPIINFNGTTQ